MSENIKMTGAFVRIVTKIGPIMGTLSEFRVRDNRVTVVDDRGRTWRIAGHWVIRMEDAS